MTMTTLDGYLSELLAPDSAPAAVAAASMPSLPAPMAQVDIPGPMAMHANLAAWTPEGSPLVHAAAPSASTLAQRPARTRAATGGNRWLRVCIGRDLYAFELLRVQEVVRVAPVVAMRGAGHAVLGAMNLRGRIVPVLDLGLWLDVGAVNADDRSRIVIVERDDELIGMLVTAVEDVVSLEREHVEPPLAGTDPGPTLGVARVSAWPTVLLDAGALFG